MGGALRLSGTVSMIKTSFELNRAMNEGPAVSNIGNMEEMRGISFDGNFFVCSLGEYLEFVGVSEH